MEGSHLEMAVRPASLILWQVPRSKTTVLILVKTLLATGVIRSQGHIGGVLAWKG